MKRFLFILVLFCSISMADECATKYLHIATNPSVVDIYTGNIQTDFADKPNYTSPSFIPVPCRQDEIIVSLFHPEYADTTISVTLSEKDTSYLIVALRQIFDESKIQEKQKILSHRARRSLGKNLIKISIAPFAIGAISAAITAYNIGKADDEKKIISNSRIAGDSYQNARRNFKDYRRTAKMARVSTGIFLATGLTVLGTGIVLSF